MSREKDVSLEDISEALLDEEVAKLIEQERDRLLAEQQAETANTSGQECPPTWTDVIVNGELKCQGHNISYGKCPNGYTSFGTKCVSLTQDDLNQIEKGEFRLPEATRYKTIQPGTAAGIDTSTDTATETYYTQVPMDNITDNLRRDVDVSKITRYEKVLDKSGKETGDKRKIFGKRWIPNQYATFNGAPISVSEAWTRSDNGETGGLFSFQ